MPTTHAPSEAPAVGGRTDDDAASPLLRATLAAALLASAAIHLAMVPGHMDAWAAEGVAFVVAAWAQLGLAVALLVRPRRWVLAAALATSAAFVAAWAVTRIWGPPFGPHSGVAEPADFVDATNAVLEGAVVVLAGLALWRPRLAAGWSASTVVVASVVPVAALVVASAAVVSPSARDHAHGAGHDEVAADGHGHGHEGEEAVPDELGLSLLSNGHHPDIVWHDLDPATQAELDRQLAITREVAATYPTVAAAEAAGYRRAGPYSPGLGSHYTKSGVAELNPDGAMDDEDLRHPQAIIYDGNEPDSPVAGFMYYSMSTIEPTGFPGTNDVWHTHTNVCIKVTEDGIDSPLGADRDEITQEDCAAVGGLLLPFTQWMVHVWSVPGYDNPDGGVFAEVNPALACSDGTYFTLPDDALVANPLNNCASGAPGEPRADV